MDYKGKLKLELELSDKGRYLTSKQSNIYGIENSKTVIYLPLLIDKPSIKMTDTCIVKSLRM